MTCSIENIEQKRMALPQAVRARVARNSTIKLFRHWWVLLGLLVCTHTALAGGYAIVWQPGTGGQRWIANVSWSEFVKEDKKWFDKGYRIDSLSAADKRYSAVWKPGTGEQRGLTDMTFEEFKAEDSKWFNKGLRIVALELDDGRYTAFWRPGKGEQRWRAGMTVSEFKAEDTKWFDQGLRLVALESYKGRYTAVWRPGSGEQRVSLGKSHSDIVKDDLSWFKKDLRLRIMEVDGGLYTAVWTPGKGAQWWMSGLCFVDYSTADAAYFKNNMRLGFLEMQNEAYSPWKYPWKDGDSHKIGQGNNNPSGSHNGSQSFAFDFSLPSNTEILAVRDGTVEWLQESQNTFFNPSDPSKSTTKDKKPYANGSLQNWGNAVRIRHAGGLTSWYFHLKTNGVLVKVGDKVKQGQKIAISDNTGRTSGPHLHFQVQADSNNWGQSVPISFENCQVPESGDNAGGT